MSDLPSLSGPAVGFEGSRRLGSAYAPLVSSLVASVLASGRLVVTGCARGADALVRDAAPSAVVFAVASGLWGRGRGAFAARSAALVRAVAASGPGAGLVVFVDRPCPTGLAPSLSPFRGFGSGSWASAALAAALGLPLVVFWCASGPPALPPAWGAWVPAAASGPWASGWRLMPAADQPPLLSP